MLAKGLDLYFMRVTPSKTFDMLASDFNRPMLLTLLGGLATALFVVSNMHKTKKLASAWR